MPKITYEYRDRESFEYKEMYGELEVELSEYFTIPPKLRKLLDDKTSILFTEGELREYLDNYSQFDIGKPCYRKGGNRKYLSNYTAADLDYVLNQYTKK